MSSRWDCAHWTPPRWIELGIAGAALAGAVALDNVMGRLADREGAAAHSAPDLLLSVLPRVDLRPLFVWGFAAFLLCAVVVALLRESRRLAYIVWLYAGLIALRSVFIVLTPMRSPDGALWVGGDPLFEAVGRHLTFRNDLFFSSHAACPFLACLMYRDRWAKLLFLAFSLALAATVLLTRLHYTIDVLSAYFITYALVRFERRWISPRYRRLRLGLLEALSPRAGAARP